LTDPINDIEQAIEPRRLIKIWSKTILVILLVISLVVVTHTAWVHLFKIDDQLIREANSKELQSFKRDWFVSKYQEILTVKTRIETAKKALASIEDQRKASWISRESDREIYNKTLEYLLSLENELASLIKEYNTAAAMANPSDIAGLGSNLSF